MNAPAQRMQTLSRTSAVLTACNSKSQMDHHLNHVLGLLACPLVLPASNGAKVDLGGATAAGVEYHLAQAAHHLGVFEAAVRRMREAP